MERRLEISQLSGVTGSIVGVVVVAFEWLRSISNPSATPGPLFMALALVVLLFTGVAAALTFALAARLISQASGLNDGFWHASGLFLQDFALWLTMWAVFWGVPFGVAMVLSGTLTRYLITAGAVVGGTLVGILLLLAFKRYFSRETWAVLDRFWPARQVGNFWMIVAVLLVTLPGRVLLDRCYVFEVTGASGARGRGETVPIEVKLSGRVINHEALRAEISPARPANSASLQILTFDAADPGTYVGWLKLAAFAPGVYRIRVYLDNSELSGFEASLARSPSIFAPPERRFLLRVNDEDRLTSP